MSAPRLSLSRQEYRETYLRSDHWREIRRAALQRAGQHCQVCNGTKALDVHHRTYERLGNEDPADLTVLCRPCHELFHSSGALRPTRRPVAKDNWSRLSGPDQAHLRDLVLAALAEGPAKGTTAADVAQRTGRRTQVIGSCFVCLSKQGLVKKQGKRWRLVGQGVLYGRALLAAVDKRWAA